MIEVNLLPGKKKYSGPAFLNLSMINIPFLAFALAFSYLIRPIYEDYYWTTNIESKKGELEIHRASFKRNNAKAKELRVLKEEYEQMQQQEALLNKKLDAVNNVIKNKKNPMSIMLYISKNIPNEVWLSKLTINDGKFELEGEAINYKEIGFFIEKLKESVFFGREIKFDDSRTISDEKTGKRTEFFKISAKIERYD